MYKLAPDDIQGMLSDAARVLTQPKDKEIMRRLISSTRATEPSEWDKRLISAMLAKAGKMHEAEMVVHDIETAWTRADALLAMSRALNEIGDTFHSRGVLHVAVIQAEEGQRSEGEQDKLDASSVLSEIALFYYELGEKDVAKKTAELISNDSRRQKFSEYVQIIESVDAELTDTDGDEQPAESSSKPEKNGNHK
jgi:hypothetical protein